VNVDDMLKFQVEDLDENDCEKVKFFFSWIDPIFQSI
jgi:hypothetical protein